MRPDLHVSDPRISLRHVSDGYEGETDRDGFELPDPPDNLEFLDLFTPEQQDAIAERFYTGIRKNYEAVQLARAREANTQRERQAYEARRAAARERALARRFNPVLRSRP